jgi:uncharacterized protein (DUF1810 family)
MYNLNRFIEVQRKDYSKALNEIKNGKKLTHWVWYIFPQIKGLGMSDIAIYYSIDNLEEAKLYLGNDYLKNNLLEITQALLDLNNDNISEVLGYPDDLKVKSCMTLFHYAEPNIGLFKQVIDKYYNGEFDIDTINIIGRYNENR